MNSFVGAILAAMVLLPSSSFAEEPAIPRALVVGATQGGDISGCKFSGNTQKRTCATQIYHVELPADKYWRVEVEQLGIDLVLTVVPPQDLDVIAVNTPIERIGTETALVHSTVQGIYALQVSSQEHAVASGRYRISIHELPDRTPEEQLRLQAEKAVTAAAELFFKQEDPVAAIPQYEKAAALWRQLEHPAEEAQAAYCAGILYQELDDAEKAERYLTRAAALLDQLGDQSTRGYVLNALGLTLDLLGQRRQAKQHLQQASELSQDLRDPYLAAKTLNNQGLLFHFSGDLIKAKKHYDAALRLFKQLDELEEQANTTSNISGIYYVSGEPDPAFEYSERALSLSRKIGNKEIESTALGNMAALYRITGDVKKALTLFKQNLATARASTNRREEAWTLDQISLTYHDLGEYQRALAFALQALPLWRRFNDRRGEAMTLTKLGEIYTSLGDMPQALDALNQAIALRQSAEEAVGEADALIALGRALLAQGDTRSAAESFGNASAILLRVGDKRRLATALLLLGSVRVADGALEPALDILKRALSLHRSSHNQAGEAATLYQIAVAHRALGATHDALEYAEASVGIIESLRANITNPTLRASFLSVKHDVYQLNVDTLMALHEAEPDKHYDLKALEASERARARTLLDLLNEADAEIHQGIAPALLERQNALRRQINAKTENQQALLSGDHDEAEARQLEFELQSRLSELDELETRIRLRHPAYAALAQAEVLKAAEIQDLLDPDTLLLEYSLGEHRSFVWAVTHEAVHSIVLPPRDVIEAAARQLYERTRRLDPQAWRDEQQSRVALAQILLDPITEHLDRPRIVVAADGALHYVPFGALPIRDNDARQDDNESRKVLLQDHEVLYLPSASTLATLRGTLAQRRKATKQLAILGDPVFDRTDPRLQRIETAASLTPRNSAADKDASRQVDLQALQRLPFSRDEVMAISRLVPKAERLVALGFTASRATVLSEPFQHYDIIHFATHGMLNSQNPELSGLTLSRFNKAGASRAGFLALHDVYNLRLAANLVVLSGCETALGKEMRGEGLVGLTRGFMYAGAPRVLASLWRVSDKATAELMSRFYRAMLQDGLTPAAALRAAQLSFKTDAKQRRWRLPYYWAGFVLQGDWQSRDSRK